ncbi:type II secretion system F family protein [Pseudonocardia broussonetiae]|uniref:Type II secretion system F family protein n=1 Tax=Pseudonocardia broussonetiae TaxID=2736640 RepID=A0A6M6JKN6_9PSEU|nr:type II secretion system F family protein [Pseudonocardia broussonetiae]QJY47795.1 type II secretion system F family protein [Pseudonocardia broussonetiae]
MTWLAAASGALVAAGLTVMVAGPNVADRAVTGQRSRRRWSPLRAVLHAARVPGTERGQHRWRITAWMVAGLLVWVITGWPAAGAALAGIGAWSPWLLGSARAAQDQISKIDALSTWCRRMADTLTGGGAIGLAQAITLTSDHAPMQIAGPVQQLAERLRSGHGTPIDALREFADGIDDPVGDSVAAALGLALHQQSSGIARVLRQLADGVSRDVRARRDIEAERAEARQSIRTLLLIQGGVLAMLALVPGFAAPYGSPFGQLIMATLLAGTFALLIWMRKLAVGHSAPRWFGASR